ncbi:hypothetical protein C8J56DRAFT_1031343 [Mycena floridula]|nr:hypothetical protein C8J56DRAFT_1031343 [Mycena floridula]
MAQIPIIPARFFNTAGQIIRIPAAQNEIIVKIDMNTPFWGLSSVNPPVNFRYICRRTAVAAADEPARTMLRGLYFCAVTVQRDLRCDIHWPWQSKHYGMFLSPQFHELIVASKSTVSNSSSDSPSDVLSLPSAWEVWTDSSHYESHLWDRLLGWTKIVETIIKEPKGDIHVMTQPLLRNRWRQPSSSVTISLFVG